MQRRCAHIDEVYMVGFVPCSSVPNDIPEAYDPFLKPLIDDLCRGFIDGFQVPYPTGVAIDNYELREVETVRILLLCWAADHPGQCEFVKFLNQAKCGCKRCKMTGQQSEHSNHYYYGNNRCHCRYPWAKRNIELELENLYDVDNETRKSVRKSLSSEKVLLEQVFYTSTCIHFMDLISYNICCLMFFTQSH